MNTGSIILGIVIVCVLVGLLIFILRYKSVNEKSVDSITSEMVISFFKKDKVLKQLKSNSDLIAVAIKSEQDDMTVVTCCLFDKNSSEVESKLISYKSKNVAEDLLNMFGDKDMIILQ